MILACRFVFFLTARGLSIRQFVRLLENWDGIETLLNPNTT